MEFPTSGRNPNSGSTKKRQRRKKHSAIPPPRINESSGKKMTWWEQWEESESQRLTEAGKLHGDTALTNRFLHAAHDFYRGRHWPGSEQEEGIRRNWQQFRDFLGIPAKIDPESLRFDDPPIQPHRRALLIGTGEDPVEDINYLAVVLRDNAATSSAVTSSKATKEDIIRSRQLEFFNDPEHLMKKYLSSFARNKGLYQSKCNLRNIPRLLAFFVSFLLRSHVQFLELDSSLEAALTLIQRAQVELPLVIQVQKALLAEPFGLACKTCWGPKGEYGYKPSTTNKSEAKVIEEGSGKNKRKAIMDVNMVSSTRNWHGNADKRQKKKENFLALPLSSQLSTGQSRDTDTLPKRKEIEAGATGNDWGGESSSGGWGSTSAGGSWGAWGPSTGGASSGAWDRESSRGAWDSTSAGGGGAWDSSTAGASSGTWSTRPSDDPPTEHPEWNPELNTPAPLISLLGPTSLPLTHQTGIVESSMRKIKSVTLPSNTSAERGERSFARVVLSPWLDWDSDSEGGAPYSHLSRPRILASSRGATAGSDNTNLSAHDPLKYDIVLYLDPSALDGSLVVGLGIYATWVQLVRVDADKCVSEGAMKEENVQQEEDAQFIDNFWYIDSSSDHVFVIPSFWTPCVIYSRNKL